MDLREEVQKLLDEDPSLDEDQADMLSTAACLLAAAAAKKARPKPGKGGSEEKEKGRVCR